MISRPITTNIFRMFIFFIDWLGKWSQEEKPLLLTEFSLVHFLISFSGFHIRGFGDL